MAPDLPLWTENTHYLLKAFNSDIQLATGTKSTVCYRYLNNYGFQTYALLGKRHCEDGQDTSKHVNRENAYIRTKFVDSDMKSYFYFAMY